MTERVNIRLGEVQKTLFLPLWGRAVESIKSEPLLVDQAAVQILEQVDFDFSEVTQNIDDLTQIAWIQRSLFCDQVVREYLARYPVGTIVNIGCGLDTTYERIDNGKLRWYDLDLPDVIELRAKFMSENERRKFISASFLEEEWLGNIQVSGVVLIIAAGVFYYFEEPVIKGFFLRLMDACPNCEVIFDVSSPLGVKIANRKVVESSGLDEASHLIWGLKRVEDFLSWDPRINIKKTYHYYQIPGIGFRNRVMGMLANFLGIQYMVHLELGGVLS